MPRGGARVGAGRPKGSVSKPKSGDALKPKAKGSAKSRKAARPRVDIPGVIVPTYVPEHQSDQTPLEYMLAVMNDPRVEGGRRDRMAVAAAVYLHSKQGEKGVKATRKDAAKSASTGKFAAGAAPKLVVSNR